MSDEEIERNYHTINPHFSYICGGLRRIAVDSQDRRARDLLLRRPTRYFATVQGAIYACHMLMRPTTFIDVGVNYGECLFAKPLYDRTPTFGFEANPALLPYVEKSKFYNDDVEVQLIAKAVSDSAGDSLTFYVHNRYSGKSTLVRPDNLKGVTEIVVPSTTLDNEMLPRGGDLSRLLVKIDIEGYEPKAMRGARRLFAAAANAVVLIEFDSLFMETAGFDISGFFDELLETFEVYLLRDDKVNRVTSLAELPREEETSRIHCDLVLMKFADKALRSYMLRHMANASIRDLAIKGWTTSFMPARPA